MTHTQKTNLHKFHLMDVSSVRWLLVSGTDYHSNWLCQTSHVFCWFLLELLLTLRYRVLHTHKATHGLCFCCFFSCEMHCVDACSETAFWSWASSSLFRIVHQQMKVRSSRGHGRPARSVASHSLSQKWPAMKLVLLSARTFNKD